MVMEVVDEDMDTGMSCNDHPYKTQTAGGICAFCLQDKLGKLVSSSFPSAIFPAASVAAAASSVSSPSSSSDPTAASASAAAAIKNTPRRAKQSFLGKSHHHDVGIVFQRSKSTAAATRPRGFWSFLGTRDGTRLPGIGSSFRHRSLRERRERESGGDCNDDERKVSRSRSVGCGSRSFSGDFFERLSTGLGDCALRRVESQREGKPKNTPVHGPRDRVRCGGIFGSFSSSSTTTSSSSSATSFSHAPPVPLAAREAAHGRSRSWGWALTSPMRAFSSNKTKRENGGGRKPNLNAIPSILAVGG